MKHKMQRFSVIGLALTLAFTALYLLLTFTVTSAKNLPVAAAHPQAVINACGTIPGTTTWTSDNLYVADNCDVIVPAGMTLTIQAGTAVKFGGAASALIVNGGLAVEGTEPNPVAITSLHDDSHGDAAPGSSGTPAAGDWYGIHFADGSAGNIERAFIGYAGSGGWNAALGLWNSAQVRVVNASLTMRYATVDSGLRTGIYFEGAGITPTLQHVQVSNNAGNTSWPYSNAVYQDSINMQPAYSDLTFSGNDVNAVVVLWDASSPMAQSATLGGTVFSFNCGYTSCPLTIPDGLTLTVAPGTQLSFPDDKYSLVVDAGATLLAEGMPTQPITFTSILTAPVAGGWRGIVVNAGATARLAHCDVSYGGAGSVGGLDLSATDVQVSDCHIQHHASDGVYMRYQNIAPAFTDVDVTDNGRYGIHFEAADTRLTFEGGSIQRNAQDGVSMGTSGSGNRPTFRNVAVNDNGGDGMHLNAHGTAALLENVDFNGNTGAAVRWWAGTSPTFRNLSASGNGNDALINTGGDVWGGQHWAVADAGLPVYLVGDTKIRGGALLSIEPGSTLILTPTVSISDWWADSGGSSLYALGTDEKPITFTGVTQTPGAWGYIQFGTNDTLFLNHCTVEYGGANTAYGMIDTGGSGTKVVQNSRIHHSLGTGFKFSYGDLPVLRNNEIYSNVIYGVLKTYGPSLDARNNWWGDASGPTHYTNPDGTGDAVGEYDNVVFTPWLTAPPTGTVSLGQMIVDTGAPELVSPGQTVDYALYYLNGMTQTVENAVLMMQLPAAAEYVDSSHGGIYWPERDQVFWKPGDLTPNATGMPSARVRFQWGLQPDYQDGVITLLAGSNYQGALLAGSNCQQTEMNVTPYLEYQPVTLVNRTLLSEAEFAAERAAYPELQALYDEALVQGYSYFAAARVELDDGHIFTEAIMLPPNRQSTRLLIRAEDGSLAYTINRNEVAVHDATGGMTMSLTTNQQTFWGSWHPDASLAADAAPAGTLACTPGICKVNCLGQTITLSFIGKKAGKILAWTAFSFFTGGAGAPAAVWEVGSTTYDIYKCFTDCADPNTHCCTGNQVRWSTGWSTGLLNGCWKKTCDPTTGAYGNDGMIYCTGNNRCVAGMEGEGGGCRNCGEGTANADCAELGLLRGKDPNAKYGPIGDLLPGQLVTYTITYENVGEGRVYGVYVTDQLADVFDANTLQIQSGGVYLPYDRTLVWMVGELGPQGDPDSEGVMTFTVRLRDDLPSGTVVRNEATVFFPSVPEETPTNPVVNLIQPLVAVPQDVETNYRQPVTITLEGLSVGALPLTFQLDELPVAGSLTGTLPVLVYTPPENFASVDGFSFIVTNGITESRPAYVRITVSSVGDSTPPDVVWTDPVDGAQNVAVSDDPVYTDEIGPAYLPFPVIGFSEAISATTVTTQSIHLTRDGGQDVSISVMYDGLFNQVILIPRSPLQYTASYTVTSSTDLRDAAGNPLATAHIWHFQTAEPLEYSIYLPVVQK